MITALAACSLPGFLYPWHRPDGRLSVDERVTALSKLAWRVLDLRSSFHTPGRLTMILPLHRAPLVLMLSLTATLAATPPPSKNWRASTALELAEGAESKMVRP